MANAGLLVASLRVPPAWKVTIELNEPSEALVAQFRSVTCTSHVPSSALFGTDSSGCARSPTFPDIRNSAAARLTETMRPQPNVLDIFRFMVFLLPDRRDGMSQAAATPKPASAGEGGGLVSGRRILRRSPRGHHG